MKMREILFKAKHLNNGEWVEGYYLKYVKPLDGKIEHRIFVSDGDGVMWYAVQGETICQYTGLRDKNGNKIWENDVVRKHDISALGWSRIRNCEVSFDKLGYWLLTTEYGDGYWLGEFDAEQLEVIGNIFDNPELMENE